MSHKRPEHIGDYENRVLKKLVMYLGVPIGITVLSIYIPWAAHWYGWVQYELPILSRLFFAFLIIFSYGFALFMIEYDVSEYV